MGLRPAVKRPATTRPTSCIPPNDAPYSLAKNATVVNMGRRRSESQYPKGFVLFTRTKEPSMERYICIHGHFYQPPRENPWLEAIQLQDSAYPYHDWNERIAAECYAPNAASRILDGEGRIGKIVNNYAQISFNFG